jgi:hypothetical protein
MILWKQYQQQQNSGKLIDDVSKQMIAEEVIFWKEVLGAINNAILILAKNNLAFRGSFSDVNARNCVNFLSLIKLLSLYHAPLALHPERLSKGRTHYLSPMIQNEFISLAAGTVRKKILQNIHERRFFSILFDATPDTSHKEQISRII